MALRWFSVQHEGALLPLGRQGGGRFLFSFLSGNGGTGAFYERRSDGLQKTFQVGAVPMGDGTGTTPIDALPNSQSGLPLKFFEEQAARLVLDFLSIGRTPQGAALWPTLRRTDGIRVQHSAALPAAFGTVTYVPRIQPDDDQELEGDFSGYIMVTPTGSTLTDRAGTVITPGINWMTLAEFRQAPATGHSTDPGEFAVVTNLHAYADDAQITPIDGVLVKDTYYILERYDGTDPVSYRISKYVVSTGTYTQGPILPVTPLGLAYSAGEDEGFLALLGFSAAGTFDNLYQLNPDTGEALQLVQVAVNDPLDPFKRQGLYFLGRDPSSCLDQFVVLDGSYQNLTPGITQDVNGNWIVTQSLQNPSNYYLLTAERAVVEKDGPITPIEAPLPSVLPGDPPPPGVPRSLLPPPPPSRSRDLPTAVSKWVPFDGPFTSKTFNTLLHVLFGGNGRLYGMVGIPNGANTEITIDVGSEGGSFIVNGIVVFYPAGSVIPPIPIGGGPPYALTAFTADETSGSSVDFAVEPYNPAALSGKAILAFTDSSGFNWTPTNELGILKISEDANTPQLSDEEFALLTSRDGPIDVADTQHRHRVPVTKEIWEKLTNTDYDIVPHPPKATPPVNADELHDHENLLTDFEIDALTGRGGVTSGDSQHNHNTLPSAEAFAAVFGGPTADASLFHQHPLQAHGVIANDGASLVYVPQNVGTGTAYVNATASTFTGSFSLILGESVLGSGVNRITGIRYKAGTEFMFSTRTAAIGGTTPGDAVNEITETFDPDNPSGVLAPVPFNEEFTWRGITIRLDVPETGGAAFTLPTEERPRGDFFTANGVIAASVDRPGSPSVETPIEEGFLSRCGLKFAVVLDDRFPNGGYLSIGLS